MLRFILRTLALVALSIAVIMAVIDATRSVAAERLFFTPLEESWASFSQSSLNGLREAAENTAPFLWDPVLVFVLSLPGWIVFSAFAVILFIAGRGRRRHVLAV